MKLKLVWGISIDILGGSMIYPVFHPSEADQMSTRNTIPGDLVVKSNLCPHSGSAASS